jgi:hypothetical protein
MALPMNRGELEAIFKGIMTGLFRNEISRIYSFVASLERLECEENKLYSLEFVLKNFGLWSPSKQVIREKNISQGEFNKIAAEIGPDLIFAFRKWIVQNISESELANKIYSRIKELVSFNQKVVAFSLIIFDKDLIPYRQIPNSLEGLSFTLSDVNILERDVEIQESHNQKAALIRNITLRSNKSRFSVALIYKIIESEPSPAERYMLTLRWYDAIEEKFTTAGSGDWKVISEKAYA